LENDVPEGRRHAEAAVVIGMMVRHVMAAQELAPSTRRNEVMYVVMRAVVKEVADDESGEERLAHDVPERERKDRVEKYGERDARQKRHHEAVFVARVVVMDPVEQEMDPSAPGSVVNPVEHVPVQNVLGKRPREHAAEKQAGHDLRRELSSHQAPDEKKGRDRHPGQKRRRRMNAGKALEKIALEHPTRFGTRTFRPGMAPKVRFEYLVDHVAFFVRSPVEPGHYIKAPALPSQ
jgi:hypothetical protein